MCRCAKDTASACCRGVGRDVGRGVGRGVGSGGVGREVEMGVGRAAGRGAESGVLVGLSPPSSVALASLFSMAASSALPRSAKVQSGAGFVGREGQASRNRRKGAKVGRRTRTSARSGAPADGTSGGGGEALKSRLRRRDCSGRRRTKNKDGGRRPDEDECQERWLGENWLGRASVPLTDHQGGNKIPAAR